MVHLDCLVGLIARVVFRHFLVGIWLFYKKKLEQEEVTSVQLFYINVTGGDEI